MAKTFLRQNELKRRRLLKITNTLLPEARLMPCSGSEVSSDILENQDCRVTTDEDASHCKGCFEKREKNRDTVGITVWTACDSS